MTLLTFETIILWISFANTNMRYACLHKQSTLLRKYPPKGISRPLIIQACLCHPCIPAPREMWLCLAGFEPAIYCLKWDMCPSYPDSTWQTGQDDVPPHHPTMAVFIVSPALSQPKTWHAQSSICKNSFPDFKIPRPSRLYPILCIILLTCPDPSHIHPKELSSRFVRHA